MRQLEVETQLGDQGSARGGAGERAGQRHRMGYFLPYAVTRSASGGSDARFTMFLADVEGGSVERGQASSDRVDEVVEFVIGQGPGDPAPPFGGGGVVVVAAEDHLEGGDLVR